MALHLVHQGASFELSKTFFSYFSLEGLTLLIFFWGGGTVGKQAQIKEIKLILLKIGLKVPPMAQMPGIFAYFESMHLLTLKEYCRL